MRARGFSMIELAITLAILAVISAIAAGRFSGMSSRAEQTSVAEHLRRMSVAFELYHAHHRSWPEDTPSGGVFPPAMLGYLHERDFAGSPLGGKYDWQQWADPHRLAGGCSVSVTGVQDWEAALEVDRQLDDGDLSTGSVRRYSHFLLLEIDR